MYLIGIYSILHAKNSDVNISNILFLAVGLIIAILIPVAVAVIVGVVTSILCYRKREW